MVNKICLSNFVNEDFLKNVKELSQHLKKNLDKLKVKHPDKT